MRIFIILILLLGQSKSMIAQHNYFSNSNSIMCDTRRNAPMKEVKQRFSTLNVAPYKGFIQPKLVPIMVGGKITDVKVEYPTDFVKQMMEYGKQYGLLPIEN